MIKMKNNLIFLICSKINIKLLVFSIQSKDKCIILEKKFIETYKVPIKKKELVPREIILANINF
jgi:hypothetical protein